MIRPRIKAHLDVISEAGGVYYIRNSEFMSVLKGATARELFGSLLPLLDGSLSMNEIITRLDKVAAPEVIRAVVRKLHESKIIDDAAEDEKHDFSLDELDRYRRQLVFLDLILHTGSPLEYQNRLRESRVSIIGSGNLAHSFTRQLARIGVGRIFGANLSRDLDIERENPSVSFSAAEIDFADWKRTEAAIREERPSVLALALDQPEPSIIEPVNALAIDLGIGLLHCQTNGAEGIVGPFVVPGQTACLVCHHVRATRNLDFYREHRVWEQWAMTNGKSRGISAQLAPFTDTIAGMAAIDMFKHASGCYEAETYGKFLTISALTFEVVSHQALRLPRCTGCGNTRRENSYSPWQEL